MPYRIVTLIYCVREGRVLLLRRRKPPYAGYWVAPGGKVERGESPHEGAVRELREESGLAVERAELRAVVTECSAREDWQWLIFVYRASHPRGELQSDGSEGELRWFDIEQELAGVHMPPADRVFVPQVLGERAGALEYRFDYDDDLALVGGGPRFVV